MGDTERPSTGPFHFRDLGGSLVVETPRTILVVDDDDGVRDLLELALKVNNHVVLKAKNASEAIDIYRAEKIDLVLSDVRMPGQMGPELIRTLQGINPNVRFCFITGGDLGKYTMQDLTESGAQLILQKPFSIGSILRCLNDILCEEKNPPLVGPHARQHAAGPVEDTP